MEYLRGKVVGVEVDDVEFDAGPEGLGEPVVVVVGCEAVSVAIE